MATTFDILNAGNPQDVTTVADISTITSATPKGSLIPKPVLPADTAPVNQMMSYTDIINQSQQDLANTQASRNQEMIDQSIKRYLGLDGGVGVAERKQEEINAINEKFDVSGTSARLAKIKADIEANKLSAEGQKQGIGQNTGGLTEADIAGFGEQIDRRIASKNLALSAEGLALQGNLAAAESAIKSSVDAKYAPIEAKYKAILEYNTLNEKTLGREAEKQQQRANAKLKELEEKKKSEEEVGVMIAQAIPNAPTEVIERAKKLQESGASKLAVAQALGVYGGDYLKNELLKEQLKTEKAQRAKIYSDIDKNKPQPVTTIEGKIATLPKSQQDRYYKLQGDFDKATEKYRGAIDAAGSLQALSENATPQAQTAIIFQYMKTLDPASTVREGEFALVGGTAGLGDRAINVLKRLDNGQRLNSDQIKEIVGAAQTLANDAKKNLDATSKEYDRRANIGGLPSGLFTGGQQVDASEDYVTKSLQALESASNYKPDSKTFLQSLMGN